MTKWNICYHRAFQCGFLQTQSPHCDVIKAQYHLLHIARPHNRFSSVAQLCLTLCDPMNRITPGLPIQQQFSAIPPKLKSIELVMLNNHLILRHPILLMPSIFPSIRVFSDESLFVSGGKSIGVSASTSVLSVSI